MRIIGKIKLLDVKNDVVFQEIFGKQKNSQITQNLLSLILERKIENVDLDINKRMLGNRIDSKRGRLDIRVKFNDGEDADIEIQVAPYEYMVKRMLEYWASMYTLKINRGNSYEKLKPCIGILITDYKLKELKEIEEYHTVWNLRERKKKEKVLTKDIEFHILEIPKIRKEEILQESLALWLEFIKNPRSKGVRENMEGNKYLKQAMEELEYLSSEPDFQRLVEAREGFLRDQEAFEDAGIKKGIKRGIKKGRREIAKELIKKNMTVKEIAEITKLTENEIKKLKQQLK